MTSASDEKYIIYIYLFTVIGLLPGGSGYFTCKQKLKLVTTRFKSGGLHEKHVVATWNLGNHHSICLWTQGNQEKPVSKWPVAGPSEYLTIVFSVQETCGSLTGSDPENKVVDQDIGSPGRQVSSGLQVPG